MQCLQQGFRDREERAEQEIRKKRDLLADVEKEKGHLEAIFRKAAHALNRLREEKDTAVWERDRDKERFAEEEERDRTELATVMTHTRVLRKRLEELERDSSYRTQ